MTMLPVLESPLRNHSPQFAHADHPVWGEIEKYFRYAEFNNPEEMDVSFLRLLYQIRKDAGVPMHITSDARDPNSNVGADHTAHKKRPCRAIDGQVQLNTAIPGSEQLARIVIAAVKNGIVRIGIYKSEVGLGDIYHLDAETHWENPSPRIWTKW